MIREREELSSLRIPTSDDIDVNDLIIKLEMKE